MSLAIHLLGPTRVERSGDEIPPPRGHKAWGLLTYLVRTPAPSSRERLGGLLFPEADDPMGSLRWTLSVLRRFLGDDVVLAGDPLRLSLPPGTFVDVDVLSRGSWVEAVALPGLGHELLDGMAFPSSPGFENWLENERRYVAGTTAGVLRQAALGRLGYGEPRIAVKHASELVRLEPFDQNAHALLVRCMRAVGDLEGAAQHVSACVELFRAELGVEPTLGLHEETAAAGEHGPRGTRRAAVLAQIETGEAVITAGAVEAGLERLRGAVAAARASSDRELLARSLIALGGALVHGARGTDVEGAAALHEGIALAEDVGADELAATGWREVSWVQFLRAEYDRAETSIGRAAAVAALDEELAWIDLILGSCRNDVGERVAAAGLLGSAVERLRLIGPSHPLALALTMLARVHLAARAVDESRTLLDEALDVVEVGRLTAFRPWPESFRAEIDLVEGDIAAAESRFEHAFAVGCEVGDPCWESVAARGLGLVAAARGDIPRALELLSDAPRLCRRLPDTYLWIEVYGLDALCAVAIENGAASTARWVEQLEFMSARHGMRDLLLNATLYRARLGEPGAVDAARSLAAQLDRPTVGEPRAHTKLSSVG